MLLDLHAIFSLVITAGALALFSRSKIPIEYSCAAILVTLVVVFELFPYTGFASLRGADFRKDLATRH